MADVDADDVIKKLLNLGKNVPDQTAVALYQEALIEVKECVQVTPVETGALRATIHAERPVRQNGHISVAIVAGGPSAPYAEKVHEDPDAFHRVGGWKFIENPLKAAAPHIASRVGARIDLQQAAQ